MKNYKLVALVGVAVVVAIVTLLAVQNKSRDGSMASHDKMQAGENSTLMQQARQAFWARDLLRAENSYRQLIEGGQGSADTWGELGNVYYLQAKWPQAAEAYTEASLLLIDLNAVPQAMYLHHIVMRMDRQQAIRIDEKLRSLYTAAPKS